MSPRTTRTVPRAIGGVLAVAALATVPATAHATHPAGEGGGSSLPSVSMEAVLLAAQLDPARPGTGKTAGAARSVIRVERAMKAKGLLDASLVDGSYGSSTIQAFSAWQGRLGFSGIGANGLPGETSLTRLGARRFRVTNVVRVGPRVSYGTAARSATVSRRTRAMLRAAARNLGQGCVLGISQGSYNAGGVDASAGTHDGGGAVDVSVHELCGKTPTRVVRALRNVGFAAWHRLPSQGPWEEHIHGIAISDPDLSAGARDQVADYFNGLNGLASHAADDGPKVPKTTWEAYRRAH
jgi:peptidoglycan hydrolase-like protein with peptidoglycan-binding domain